MSINQHSNISQSAAQYSPANQSGPEVVLRTADGYAWQPVREITAWEGTTPGCSVAQAGKELFDAAVVGCIEDLEYSYDDLRARLQHLERYRCKHDDINSEPEMLLSAEVRWLAHPVDRNDHELRMIATAVERWECSNVDEEVTCERSGDPEIRCLRLMVPERNAVNLKGDLVGGWGFHVQIEWEARP
jgi:hypothetical protein